MKKVALIIGIVVVLILTALVGNSFLRGKNGSALPEQITQVVRRDIGSSVLATGVIKPMVGAEVKVGSRISGVVKHLRTNIGDVVKSGQIIAELEDAELQARLNQNLASLAKAQADYDLARASVGRERSLLEKSLISQEQADQAESAYRVAEAQIKIAEANVDFARVQLSYTKILAPISGVVASISTQEGETISASLAAPTFVSIIDLRRLEVQAYVDETDIGKIQVGQQASFTVDTYSDSDFKGTLTAIYPKAVIQDNVVNYIVTVGINDSQGKILRPEMTTSMTIYLETRKNVLSVPTSAITRERAERYVTVIEDEKKIQRKVKTGWKDNGFTEIISGLKEGEQILVTVTNQENIP